MTYLYSEQIDVQAKVIGWILYDGRSDICGQETCTYSVSWPMHTIMYNAPVDPKVPSINYPGCTALMTMLNLFGDGNASCVFVATVAGCMYHLEMFYACKCSDWKRQ